MDMGKIEITKFCPTWSLEQALDLIRKTQFTAKSFGYHICIGGGVLNSGSSDKDLDIYFLPLIGEPENYEGLLESLEIGWGPGFEFGYGDGQLNKPSPYRMTRRYFGSKLTFGDDKVLEVFIV